MDCGGVCFTEVGPWCFWEVQSFSISSCGLENIWADYTLCLMLQYITERISKHSDGNFSGERIAHYKLILFVHVQYVAVLLKAG